MCSESLVLGVDAGGTSTRAVLTTAEGTAVGYGVSGSGNPISVGPDGAVRGVWGAVEKALAQAGAAIGDVSLLAAAMAGNDATGPGEWLRDPLAAEGFTGDLVFESDLLAMYFSGTVAEAGYGVVCGTGSSVIRVEGGRTVATADGLGWLLGDRGSGFWIGRRVARAVVEDLDDTGPVTTLTPATLARLGIADASDGTAGESRAGVNGRRDGLEALIHALYAARPIELAGLTPLAFDAWEGGDAVAAEILATAGGELVRTFEAVRTVAGPVVIGGSILARSGPPQDAFARGIAAAGAIEAPIRVSDGAAGAAFLALRHAGLAPGAAERERLVETIAALRAGGPAGGIGEGAPRA
ncbi:N-acetylglucosamine kinase-like BadF-type ATPase [Microbacterium resistens]|uniref:N-acetylglucosamine kinase-like BadF-type ATPase n=1 Tax=Microbacterium resistens TaxID=156977 RepID=A0ABU1SC09_9MICO|nr:BadF/BadG/BcrA/BcrD ATPase family protein [Microbacterium resistens]MDR6866437.1 N-acetylglucosamine kinase-like BadF-type ATPase [Microbacterium resistens]